MIKFYDRLFNNELIEIEVEDIKTLEYIKKDNIYIIENIDGLFFKTSKIELDITERQAVLLSQVMKVYK